MKDLTMVIDLDLCIGCDACTVACKIQNATPPNTFFSRVMEYETGHTPDVIRLFLPVLCNHCEEPPCVDVCPTTASFVAKDGAVLIDDKKCIGCRSCIMACPYHARTYFERESNYFPETPIPFAVKSEAGKSGVVRKCDFCDDRRAEGRQPACVEVCPTSCRIFGPADGSYPDLSEYIRSERAFTLLPSVGTKPKVYYLSSHKQRLFNDIES